AAGLGLGGRLREGRSSVEGLSARPWPGLAWPRLTFTGRFRADKAPDVLVEALALLDVPPAAYLVGDGPLRGALVRLVRARGLQAVVRLPGWSYRPARYVAGASVHVVPSREESWSQSAVWRSGSASRSSALRSMACRAPCATDAASWSRPTTRPPS